MSGSNEETRVPQGTHSTLADLLNSVALPTEKWEMGHPASRIGGAVDSLDRVDAKPISADGYVENGRDKHAHVAHSATNQSQAATHEQDLTSGQHRGAAMDIWGESKKNNVARTDAEDVVNSEAASQLAAEVPGDYSAAETDFAVADSSSGRGERLDGQERDDPISIKGRADGIAIEIGHGSWSGLMEQLTQRLGAASGFFRGGKVTLNVGIRPLQDAELQQVRQLLERFGMTLGVVRSSSEQTCQVALAQGLAANLDTVDGIQAQAALTNHDTLAHFVYRGNLRSGQILKRPETVLVLGDVNPGAQVIGDGDILIWGRLRGIAHAGCGGDVHAIISALSMEPTQLRIAGLIAVLPEEETSSWMGKLVSGREVLKRPEIAYIADDQIVVDAWDQSKPGGVMAYRR